MDNSKEFAIPGVDSTFAWRSRSIFSALNSLEADHNAYLDNPDSVQSSLECMKADPVEEVCRQNNSGNKSNTSGRKRKGSPFKVPAGVPKKSFTRDKSKWTEYSLADVTPDQMSQRSNITAAYDSLKNVQPNADDESVDDEEVESNFKHIFRKSAPCLLSDDDNKKSKAESFLTKTGIAHRLLEEEQDEDEIDVANAGFKKTQESDNSCQFVKKARRNKANMRRNVMGEAGEEEKDATDDDKHNLSKESDDDFCEKSKED